MIDLIDSGLPSPTAEQIAARAGVSLRTVFRHFDEMENLHLEIAQVVFERIRPAMDSPLAARGWPEVLHELVDRRIEVFERIAPFKAAIDIHRHRSRSVAAQHQRITAISRDLLAALLPADVVEDQPLFESLVLLLSLESWQRLRDQQGLDCAAAAGVLHCSVALLAAGRRPLPA